MSSSLDAKNGLCFTSKDKQQLQINAHSILSKREQIIENFLQELSSCVGNEHIETSLTGNGGGGSNINCESFDECQEQDFLYDMEKKLASASILLSNKYGPILKQLMSQKQQQIFSDIYVRIPKSLQAISSSNAENLNLSVVYNNCFSNWIDSSCISIHSPNKILLKNVLPKDMYILTFYSMACVKRTKFDECFSLAVCGKSSTGKTRMIESVLQEAAFSFNSEKGVGRYNGCKHRPILMYHDIDISSLHKGTDGAIFRSLSRTEPTNVKVHSSLITLPPLWIMISSNQRINTHTFEKITTSNSLSSIVPFSSLPSTSTSTSTAKKTTISITTIKNENASIHPYFVTSNIEKYESQLEVTGAKRELLQESLNAVRMRVLEIFVKSKPNLDSTPLPSGIMFNRINLIVGLYKRVVDTMKKYSSVDFHSPVLISYVLTALCANFNYYSDAWPNQDPDKISKFEIASLIITYVSDENQKRVYFKILDFELSTTTV